MEGEQSKPYDCFPGSSTKKRSHQELTIVCQVQSSWVGKKPRTGYVGRPYMLVRRVDWESISGSDFSMASGKSDLCTGLENNKTSVLDYGSSVLEEEKQVFSEEEMEAAEALIFMKYSSEAVKEIAEIGGNQELDDGVLEVGEEEDPWKIKKRLTSSDIGGNSRLMLSKLLVREHILGLLDYETSLRVEDGEEFGVSVWDVDSETECRLVLKRWKSSDSYILISGWRKEFVKRRHLEAGDQIGLFYDVERARLNFSVLQRSEK